MNFSWENYVGFCTNTADLKENYFITMNFHRDACKIYISILTSTVPLHVLVNRFCRFLCKVQALQILNQYRE
ncbi:hypothetical protein TSAR_012065 [Trichomalopsis sarcophagae]|uniref:Uncharacterized protein n=1 Tax=Trichomalopsis sarcophagae TaxID=543379 RepID=A0A232EVE9_9HYME|nr:hypothetical protein TSAR_012065 [Trichomalopsis sarcophagae]